MDGVTWFDANMSAVLGAILYKAGRGPNTVWISGLSRDVKNILAKNGFLSNYGSAPVRDTHGTTILYKRFEPTDERFFAEYIDTHLRGKGMPTMSPALRKKFMESVFEVFSNARIHSRTELGIYSCGQFFPKKGRLDFSVADLGIGIPANLRETMGIDLPDEEAIQWVLEERRTTKTGSVPGGIGLKLLREFIKMNSGRMQIISGSGYWESGRNGETFRAFQAAFPGTIVNMEFNTADEKSYRLKSEIRPEDIF